MNRDDITYGIRDYEIIETATGIIFMELIVVSYFLGMYTHSTNIGGAIFLVGLLGIIVSRVARGIIFLGLYLTAVSLIHIIWGKDTIIVTVIAAVFLFFAHVNAYYFYEN